MSETFTIKECLRGYTTEALGEVCASRQLAVTNRDSRIRALEKILRDPLHIDQSIKSLRDSALRALKLVDWRGRMRVVDLVAVPGLYGAKEPLEQVESLVRDGLLLALPEQNSGAFSISHIRQSVTNGVASPTVCVPEGIARRLPAPRSWTWNRNRAKPATPPKPATITQRRRVSRDPAGSSRPDAPITSTGTPQDRRSKAYEMAAKPDSRAMVTFRDRPATGPRLRTRFVTTAAANELTRGRKAQRALFEAYLTSERCRKTSSSPCCSRRWRSICSQAPARAITVAAET